MNNTIMSSNGTTYALQTQLGSGSFGTVYKVLDLRTNKYYACKIISKGLLYKYNAEQMIRQEIQIQSTLNHKNILKVYHSFEDSKNIYIISEFCSRGSLQIPKTPYQEKEVFNICISMLGALDCLHQNKIIHRDLKLENVFLHDDGTYKLGDFGWATYIDKVEPILCGTTEYMPPEVVLKKQHDYKVDCYSLGTLIYILLHTHYPFQANSQSELIAKITSQEVIVNSHIDEDLQILIQALLTKDPNDRPTVQQLYLSRWIKNQMKLNNIFNKYENEQLKNKFRNKNIAIKTLEVNGSIKGSLSDSQKSSLTHSSSTQISSSNNACSPVSNKGLIDSIFNFKEFDNINSVPQPKLY
ncbi:unnamed protein product (macronuclear) [Paramecium tetraurelia]|uniref:Protein kinase domain-containing protein n=1 Tax=Paramecium tetraurelia TaxID=5888 RepID=A0DLV8_PARTE|nr:uncharacterized protein GSPATT00039658001 [Paramecium tetraurelia]CAK84025.1 unnamed protein product [Paramecium tetraurelia]|eukprot:XP_001451422.1 hypothetical protein (macronuclear) [Paramecium tetraurelia strain d4-2]